MVRDSLDKPGVGKGREGRPIRRARGSVDTVDEPRREPLGLDPAILVEAERDIPDMQTDVGHGRRQIRAAEEPAKTAINGTKSFHFRS